MNSAEPKPAQPSAFLPLLLIALAFITVQTGAVFRDRGQVHALKVQAAQLESASRQGQEADAKLESLLSSLLRLAEVDSDAKAIVTRYRLHAPSSRVAGDQ